MMNDARAKGVGVWSHYLFPLFRTRFAIKLPLDDHEFMPLEKDTVVEDRDSLKLFIQCDECNYLDFDDVF